MRANLALLIIVAMLAACASFKTDPQAPTPKITIQGLRYEEPTGRIFIDDMEADQLVCVHPRAASYQHTGVYCAEVRDLTGYLMSTARLEP